LIVPLQPGTTLGPYSVTAKIGEGGIGEVYRAIDLDPDDRAKTEFLVEETYGLTSS
jgi:hypothetical protein